jgi:hypothetical protein
MPPPPPPGERYIASKFESVKRCVQVRCDKKNIKNRDIKAAATDGSSVHIDKEGVAKIFGITISTDTECFMGAFVATET